jgi:hypothetical protein
VVVAETRESWQVRCLRHADGVDRAVILSIFAHSYEDRRLLTLLYVVFGTIAVKAPFLCSAGKIDKRGRVCADVITRYEILWKMQPLYENEIIFRDALRRLANRLKLDGRDRVKLFELARKWIVCDYRLDPTLDPRDPDAKRLVDGNRRLAH